jgi:16S rRNA (uracil1498-N3)-methyltransferase
MRIYLPDSLSIHQPLLLGRQHKKRLIRVMRLRTGDTLEVFTPGRQWSCQITKVFAEGVELVPMEEKILPELPGPRIRLAQALIRHEKFEWFIQKATELGVNEIFPLVTQHTVVKPVHVEEKLQRWNEIAQQAAGQSENAYPPIIYTPEHLESFLKRPSPENLLFLQERDASQTIKKVVRNLTGNSITAIVGPEGGWADQEIELLQQVGAKSISLGRRILRAETAGLALIAIIQYELGDFG